MLIEFAQMNHRLVCFWLLVLIFANLNDVTCKILDLGPKLPDFITEHPDKGWLVKFYAPWCHHCQQLEPTLVKVSEFVHNHYQNLIVGRVDCTKHGYICEKYKIQSYPTIVYLTPKSQIRYRGDRSVESLIDFAKRVHGPDIKQIKDCERLEKLRSNHEFAIISVGKTSLYEIFKNVASAYKSTYWFYEIQEPCRDVIVKDGVFMLKRHLDKAIEFKINPESSDSNRTFVEWIIRESFPIFGSMSEHNFERIMAIGKTLVIAVLDEYKPARKFTPSSKELYRLIEKFAQIYARQDNSPFLFLWSSDLHLIQTITIRQVVPPNLLILNSNYSHHLMIDDSTKVRKESGSVPGELDEQKIAMLLTHSSQGRLIYHGGETYSHKIHRYIYGNYVKAISMYNANPLLVSVLVGLPSIIMIIVIYTTCCYEPTSIDREEFDDDEDDYNEDDDIGVRERQRLLNHVKQD